MPTTLRFTKMEGAGNDYVYVDALHDAIDLDRAPAIARFVADRRFGVGGDGLIVLASSEVADVRMMMWNADGSRASMCGNGIRCVAKLAHDVGAVATQQLRIESDAGVHDVTLLFQGDAVCGARVGMGTVQVTPTPVAVEFAGQSHDCYPADVGNPHAVVFCDSPPDDALVHGMGAMLQTDARFANGTGVNVEFVTIADEALTQRTFERGSGETHACGTGATAAACVAVALGKVCGPRVGVALLGGDLEIECADPAVMAGPARTVFRGEIELPDFT